MPSSVLVYIKPNSIVHHNPSQKKRYRTSLAKKSPKLNFGSNHAEFRPQDDKCVGQSRWWLALMVVVVAVWSTRRESGKKVEEEGIIDFSIIK